MAHPAPSRCVQGSRWRNASGCQRHSLGTVNRRLPSSLDGVSRIETTGIAVNAACCRRQAGRGGVPCRKAQSTGWNPHGGFHRFIVPLALFGCGQRSRSGIAFSGSFLRQSHPCTRCGGMRPFVVPVCRDARCDTCGWMPLPGMMDNVRRHRHRSAGSALMWRKLFFAIACFGAMSAARAEAQRQDAAAQEAPTLQAMPTRSGSPVSR